MLTIQCLLDGIGNSKGEKILSEPEHLPVVNCYLTSPLLLYSASHLLVTDLLPDVGKLTVRPPVLPFYSKPVLLEEPQPLQAMTTKIPTNPLSYLGLWKADFLQSCVLSFAWNTTGYIAFCSITCFLLKTCWSTSCAWCNQKSDMASLLRALALASGLAVLPEECKT